MKRLMIFLFVGILFLFLINGISAVTINSAPSNLNDGSSVTISGSDFGTKAQAVPVLWDTFENGIIGNNIRDTNAIIGSWDSSSLDPSVYSSAIARSGSKSSYHDYKNSYSRSLPKNMQFSRLYMDFWIYVDYVDVKSRNWKP